jgi:hypothetical protein
MNTKKIKPKYLALDPAAKQELFEKINTNSLDDTAKQTAQECMLFLDTIEQELKRPGVTASKIKQLFELYEEKLKKLQLIQ